MTEDEQGKWTLECKRQVHANHAISNKKRGLPKAIICAAEIFMVSVCVCTHTHKYTHTYTHTHIHTHTLTHTQTHSHTHSHMYTHTDTHPHIHTLTHSHTHTHTHTDRQTHTHTHTHTHTGESVSTHSSTQSRQPVLELRCWDTNAQMLQPRESPRESDTSSSSSNVCRWCGDGRGPTITYPKVRTHCGAGFCTGICARQLLLYGDPGLTKVLPGPTIA